VVRSGWLQQRSTYDKKTFVGVIWATMHTNQQWPARSNLRPPSSIEEQSGVKLLFYSHYFAPSIGGVETIVLSLARGLAEVRTHDGLPEFSVTLVTETLAEDFDDRLLPFRVLRQPSLVQLLKLIRSTDIIHVAGPALSPLLLGWLTRRSVVIEHHGFQTICPTGQLLIEPSGVPCPGHFMAGRHLACLRCRSNNNWLNSWKLWLLTFLRRFLCSRVATNIMPTEWLSGLVHLPNSLMIPHGIESTIRASESARSPGPPLIIFHGRLVTTKGLPVLLEAASLLRSENHAFELMVIGDGPERSAIEEVAKKLQLSSCVRFVGRIAAADLDSTLAKASIVIVPSLGGEVFGLVLAENMSRGIPVVASDVGCFAEVLGDAGLTFRVGDAKDLASQIARLLDDSGLASALSGRARRRILEHYQRSQMIAAHAQLYRRNPDSTKKRFTPSHPNRVSCTKNRAAPCNPVTPFDQKKPW
jgi:glycosyltransferase involved in cell wall biosynthesis